MKCARLVLLCISLIFTCGCKVSEVDRDSIARIGNEGHLGHLYYTGSTSKFDYFVRKSFLRRSKTFRVVRGQVDLERKFQRSSEESDWVPFLIDLGKGWSGFKFGSPSDWLDEDSAKR